MLCYLQQIHQLAEVNSSLLLNKKKTNTTLLKFFLKIWGNVTEGLVIKSSIFLDFFIVSFCNLTIHEAFGSNSEGFFTVCIPSLATRSGHFPIFLYR
jgi:hypothetical protein